MPSHPVARTLERDVLPYIVSARRLRRQWFIKLHSVFGYTTDLVAALAAAGVSSPLLGVVGGVAPSEPKPGEGATLGSALALIPGWLSLPAAILLIVWIVLRVAFNREDGQKRAVLAKSCTQVLRQAEAGLPNALSKPDPMPALTELLEKSIRPTVDRNIQDYAWPWTPFAPEIEAEVASELNRLRGLYETDWAPVGPIGQRARVPGGVA